LHNSANLLPYTTVDFIILISPLSVRWEEPTGLVTLFMVSVRDQGAFGTIIYSKRIRIGLVEDTDGRRTVVLDLELCIFSPESRDDSIFSLRGGDVTALALARP
jgi:hypothetical protein